MITFRFSCVTTRCTSHNCSSISVESFNFADILVKLTEERLLLVKLFANSRGRVWQLEGPTRRHCTQRRNIPLERGNSIGTYDNLRQYNSPVTTVSQMASHGQSPPRWELNSTESQANRLFCFYGSATLLCS